MHPVSRLPIITYDVGNIVIFQLKSGQEMHIVMPYVKLAFVSLITSMLSF